LGLSVDARRNRCRDAGCDELPRFGPMVEIVSVTAVVPAPAAIDAGVKPQLAPGGPVINGGRPAHEKLTDELNVAAPTGAAENV